VIKGQKEMPSGLRPLAFAGPKFQEKATPKVASNSGLGLQAGDDAGYSNTAKGPEMLSET